MSARGRFAMWSNDMMTDLSCPAIPPRPAISTNPESEPLPLARPARRVKIRVLRRIRQSWDLLAFLHFVIGVLLFALVGMIVLIGVDLIYATR